MHERPSWYAQGLSSIWLGIRFPNALIALRRATRDVANEYRYEEDRNELERLTDRLLEDDPTNFSENLRISWLLSPGATSDLPLHMQAEFAVFQETQRVRILTSLQYQMRDELSDERSRKICFERTLTPLAGCAGMPATNTYLREMNESFLTPQWCKQVIADFLKINGGVGSNPKG